MGETRVNLGFIHAVEVLEYGSQELKEKLTLQPLSSSVLPDDINLVFYLLTYLQTDLSGKYICRSALYCTGLSYSMLDIYNIHVQFSVGQSEHRAA